MPADFPDTEIVFFFHKSTKKALPRTQGRHNGQLWNVRLKFVQVEFKFDYETCLITIQFCSYVQ